MDVRGGILVTEPIKFDALELAEKYNIRLKQFYRGAYRSILKKQKHNRKSVINNVTKAIEYIETHAVDINPNSYIVFTDTKGSSYSKVKTHFLAGKQPQVGTTYNTSITIVEKADNNKDILVDEFLQSLSSPPERQILYTSKLYSIPTQQVTRKPRAKNVTILKLDTGYNNPKWVNAGTTEDIGDSYDVYYVPLTGHKILSDNIPDVGAFWQHIRNCGIPGLDDELDIYGVRKADMETVSELKHWVKLEDYVAECISKIDDTTVESWAKYFVHSTRDNSSIFNIFTDFSSLDQDSMYLKNKDKWNSIRSVSFSEYSIKELIKTFSPDTKYPDISVMEAELTELIESCLERYKLLTYIQSYCPREKIVDYIGVVDKASNVI